MALNLETLQIQFEVRDNTGSKLKKLQKQLQGMGNPEIDADTKKAQKKIEDLKKKAQDADVETEIDADTEKAEKKIDDLEKAARSAKGGNITVGANTDGAIQKIKSAADTANGTTGKVQIGGDDDPFQAVLTGVKDAADGTDAGDADIGGDRGDFDTVKDTVVNAADGVDAGDADIGGNRTGFDSVKAGVESSAQNIKGGTAYISGNNKDALDKLGEVEDKIGEIPDKPEIEPEVDITNAENSLRKLYNSMKALGLIKVAKEVFEFGMSTANEAYASQAVQNQLNNLGDSGLVDKINDYAEGMQESYGLNATTIAEIAKNFTAVYKELGKGIGMSADEAGEIGIAMTQNVIDFASALDKTPGEIADIFMSVLKGNTEVADSASIYGLTADVLNKQIEDKLGITELTKKIENASEKETFGLSMQLAALKDDMEANKKYYQAMAFYEKVLETASPEGLGFAGDWERTNKELGNQQTVLEDQWKTFKETIGTYLVTPAAEGTAALNGLMKAATDWVASLGETQFTKQLEDYFGTKELTKAQQEEIIDGIVGPVKGINDGISAAINDLNGTIATYKSAHASLIALINLFYGTGEVDESQIDEAYETYKNAALETLAQGEETLITMFLTYTGTEDQWADARDAGVAGITAYYDGLTAVINEKHAAFEKLLDEAMADGTFTQEELVEIKQAALETTQTTLEGSMISYGAATQMYLDDLQKSGEFSAKSIGELYQGAMEAASEERRQMEADYNAMRQKVYEVAEANRREYERDPSAYIAKYGSAPATAQEMLAGAQAEYDAKLAQMEANLTNQISRFLLPGYQSAINTIYTKYQTGEYDGLITISELGILLDEMRPLAEKLIQNESLLGEGGIEMLGIYRFLEKLGLTNEPDYAENPWVNTVFEFDDSHVLSPYEVEEAIESQLEKFLPSLYESLMENYNLFGLSANTNPGAGMVSPLAELNAASGNLVDAIAAIPDKIDVNLMATLQVGEYEFGVATMEAEKFVSRSTG